MSLEQPAAEIRKGPTKLWLPLVLVIGIAAGFALSYTVPAPQGDWRFGPNPFHEELIVHTILSTVSVALLVALIIVYLRIYSQTGARFALGITLVFFALLIQALVQYPFFLGMFGPFGPGQGPPLSLADLFTILAYTIFLYLSLE